MIEVAAEMIRDGGSRSFRIAELAERANVGVPTIYYHFESRTQLIAEAQVANYFRITDPLHRFLSRAETALSKRDESEFWAAIHDNIMLAWRSGALDDNMGIVKLLLDVFEDPKASAMFRERLDIQFARWVAVVNDGVELGWGPKNLDAQALVAVFWSASVGQMITAGSKFIDVDAESVSTFFLNFVLNRR